MPRQHQRRHPQPVRADVEGKTQRRAARLAPAVAGEQPRLEQAVGEARSAGERRVHRRAVEAARQAQRAGDRAAQLVEPGALGERVARNPDRRREFAQQPVDVPEVPAARPARSPSANRWAAAWTIMSGRRQDAQAAFQRDAVRDQRRGVGPRAGRSVGRMVWWTSIIRSRVRWISGGSSCIQRR